jgi:hypothetical protein
MMAGECEQHLLFTAAQAHPAAAGVIAPPDMPSMPGMSMPGMAGASTSMDMSHSMAAMIAAHAVAALLCAWWLWRGENAAADVLSALTVLAMAPPWPAAATSWTGARLPRRRHTVVAARPTRLGGSVRLVADAVVRRGPPAPVASY